MGLLQIIGYISLLHAGYSSYEFTHLLKAHSSELPFPKDITLEVIVSLVLIIVDLLFKKVPSRLSLINDDVIKSEYSLKPILMKDAMVEEEKVGAGPFTYVESRPNFIDIEGKRKEFAEWSSRDNVEEKKEELKKEISDLVHGAEERKSIPVEEKIEEKLQKKVEQEESTTSSQKNNKKNGKKTKKV